MTRKMSTPDYNKETASSPSYTEPLGLMAQLKRPSVKLDVVPVLDLLVIALLFSLLFTRYVMVPGVRVDLPNSEMQMQASDRPVAVLTIGNRGMLFFDGAVFEIDSIENGFRQHMDSMPRRDVVLLIKTEGSMDLQIFLKLCRMAQDSGFVQVQIAGEHLPVPESMVPDAASVQESVSSGFLSVM